MSMDDGQTFKTVFSSQSNAEIVSKLPSSSIPSYLNLHFAVWGSYSSSSSDNDTTKNVSSLFNFKYTSSSGVEEVNYTFTEPDYFTAYNIGPQMPLWLSQHNSKSHILTSNAVFVN